MPNIFQGVSPGTNDGGGSGDVDQGTSTPVSFGGTRYQCDSDPEVNLHQAVVLDTSDFWSGCKLTDRTFKCHRFVWHVQVCASHCGGFLCNLIFITFVAG